MHARWLPSGFFPQLGDRFLRSYHATFRTSPAAVALVAEDQARPVGFLVGTLDNEAHYRWVARHRSVRLAVVGLRALVRDRELFLRFVRTRLTRYVRSIRRRLRRDPARVDARHAAPGDAAAGAAPRGHTAAGPVAVLTHVAVAPEARGSGTGRRLVEAFVERARAAGASEIRLVTPVGTDAPAFYRALGWRASGRRPAADGTLVEEFRLSL